MDTYCSVPGKDSFVCMYLSYKDDESSKLLLSCLPLSGCGFYNILKIHPISGEQEGLAR